MADSQPEPTIESIASLPADDAPTPAPAPTTSGPNQNETSKPVPSTSSSSSSSTSNSRSSSSSQKSSISALLASAPSRTDAFLTHLLKCLQTRAGADAILLFLTYSTGLSATILETLGQNLLRQYARKIVSLFFQLPAETTVALTSKPASPLAARVAMSLAGSLRAASGMLSEWRAMGRLFGLLSLYFAAKKLVLKARASKSSDEKKKITSTAAASSFDDKFDFALACAQVTSLVAFQAAENIAFLSSKKILPFAPQNQGKLAIFSVRSWGAYVGMDLGRLLIERTRKGSIGRKEPVWKREWKRNFVNNLAWAPLTVHWGTIGGVLPAAAVPAFAIIPATSAMVELWNKT